MTKGQKTFLLIVLILLIDQVSKMWVKTHMMLGQEYHVLGDWFRIHFTENNGMAFGFEIGGEYGKMALSIFRIIAVIAIAFFLVNLHKQKAPRGLLISIALILAGALGNIIDSLFYGMIFSDSYYKVAGFLPAEGGYSSFLHGKVVDMFYFPVVNTHLPDWFPFWPNRHVVFFRPVFNVADSAITIGVFSILLFQRRHFKHHS